MANVLVDSTPALTRLYIYTIGEKIANSEEISEPVPYVIQCINFAVEAGHEQIPNYDVDGLATTSSAIVSFVTTVRGYLSVET